MIKRCPQCHGKGKRKLIKRITFGPDSEIDVVELHCDDCDGEGKIYVCPASKAPREEVA